MKKKGLVIAASVMLVLCLAVGGTLAWLMDNSGPVTNTFTYGKVDIELTETTGTEYKMVPGNTIEKNPTAKVVKDSEDCWLFVKVDEADNFDTFMTYAIAEGWTLYNTGEQGANIKTAENDTYYIYRAVEASTADQSFAILAGDDVVVKSEVTKEMFASIGENKPVLTFTAYAVQKANVTTVEDAFEELGLSL